MSLRKSVRKTEEFMGFAAGQVGRAFPEHSVEPSIPWCVCSGYVVAVCRKSLFLKVFRKGLTA
jgi:hypothetical protein